MRIESNEILDAKTITLHGKPSNISCLGAINILEVHVKAGRSSLILYLGSFIYQQHNLMMDRM